MMNRIAYFDWYDPDTSKATRVEYHHDFEEAKITSEDRMAELKRSGHLLIIWSWEDIIQRMIDRAESFEAIKLPTPDEVRTMLTLMWDGHDSNYGITWDTLDYYIDEWLSANAEEDDNAA